jgi:hypothetical protein
MSAPAERDARDELGHVGVDHLCASTPREGGAVVTVDHEVRLTELDRNDRREGAVGERALERAQSVAAEGVKRAEVAGERAGAAICADERVERDLADAQVLAPERLQSPLDLVELEQPVAAASPQSLHLELKRTPAGSGSSGGSAPLARCWFRLPRSTPAGGRRAIASRESEQRRHLVRPASRSDARTHERKPLPGRKR